MMLYSVKRAVCALAALTILGACGDEPATFDPDAVVVESGREAKGPARVGVKPSEPGGSILDIFRGGDASVKVNRYLWTASLQVLDFLPIQSADPFTGVISTGYGIPPGGGRAYRATILISDPALDARSLNVALSSQSGPVDADTRRAVEDAILSRARQLRIQAENY
ncbi:DUF3576 domain-containing protein [Roseovarius nanhaiticus]|uniref:DUF3576 domain-containing protein n=1 Tax=Roseovarius nanhaiticus TaxID=573024 RepID=A0A1N7H2S7_9RHOB|nr:DUF3576 domain-containing protein [Roseovarius nanhaiticus]SEL15385.1 protein of unknown function [Roseovarius nanhaiticus]SIS19060.1 protein of unknown function [Roseovarius nanhaiticus]